jgi:hypothetical protein
MALNRITADSITDGTIVAADVADGTITLAKLVSGLLPPAIANSAAIYANGAFTAANAATATDTTQNNSITAAFAQANTDFTNITATAATYGNAISIPSITLTANGRVSAISNTAIVIDPIPNILMLSGM